MEKAFSVKGSSIRTKLIFAQQRWGDEAGRELTSYMSEQGVSRILDSLWYSFDLYDGLLRHMAKTFLEGDLSALAQVGEFSADESLNSIYKAYDSGDFYDTLEKLALLHARFYSEGEMDVRVDRKARRATIRLFDAPYYSEADLHVAKGFYLRLAHRAGLGQMTCDWEIRGDEAIFEFQEEKPRLLTDAASEVAVWF